MNVIRQSREREKKKERGGERILVKKFESSRWDKNPDSY